MMSAALSAMSGMVIRWPGVYSYTGVTSALAKQYQMA